MWRAPGLEGLLRVCCSTELQKRRSIDSMQPCEAACGGHLQRRAAANHEAPPKPFLMALSTMLSSSGAA